MTFDQMHEQNNKIIKGSGSVKHHLNKSDESGLIQWATVGTDIVRILTEFEDSINSPKSNETRKYQEDNDIFQEKFLKNVQKVHDGMVANPLNLPELTNISNTSLVFPDLVFHNISILEAMG